VEQEEKEEGPDDPAPLENRKEACSVSRIAGLLAAAALAVAPFGAGAHAHPAESTVSSEPPPGSVVPPTLSVTFDGTGGKTERTCDADFVYSVGGTITPHEYLAVRAHPSDEPPPPPGVWSKLVPLTTSTASGVLVFHGLTRGLGYRYYFTVVGPTASESESLEPTTWPVPSWVTASCDAPALG